VLSVAHGLPSPYGFIRGGDFATTHFRDAFGFWSRTNTKERLSFVWYFPSASARERAFEVLVPFVVGIRISLPADSGAASNDAGVAANSFPTPKDPQRDGAQTETFLQEVTVVNRNAVFIGSIAFALGVATVSAASGVDAEDRAEAAAVVKAPVTPTKAVQIAERDGGRAYALGMESTRKGNWYEVEVLRNDTPTEVRIDPVSGRVLGSSKAHGEDAANARALDKSNLTLSAAIAQAERTGNGSAMEATSMGSGDNANVIVDIVRGKQISHYRVSMVDGQIRASKTTQGAG